MKLTWGCDIAREVGEHPSHRLNFHHWHCNRTHWKLHRNDRNHNLEYSLMESDLELFSRFGKIHILLPVSAALFLPLDQIAKILIFHLISSSSDNNNFLFFLFNNFISKLQLRGVFWSLKLSCANPNNYNYYFLFLFPEKIWTLRSFSCLPAFPIEGFQTQYVHFTGGRPLYLRICSDLFWI